MRAAVLGLATSVAGMLLLTDTPSADACGCLSPPAVSEGDFAVNQQSEQIIFEVEPGWVTAHVLIKYAGDPASFAWIIPVPEVPELGVSPVTAFGMLDKATAPNVSAYINDACPISEWQCRYHDQPYCGDGLLGGGGDSADGFADAGYSVDASLPGGGTGVTVIGEQVVGDYQTVTFRANEATAATQWLRDNGFVVNQTTSIYMESYVQANMVFVAAKLVPGAGIKAIKPIKLRYRAAFPQVPLILTAVAAEPNLTVTSYVLSDHLFKPQGHPVVTIDERRIAQDSQGRVNYPQVLARTIDEAGGDGFIVEYSGYPIVPDANQSNMCCAYGYDTCALAGNGSCECPTEDFDAADCQSTAADITEGLALLQSFQTKYSSLTRLTTRVSAEEMTFDPAFEADFTAVPTYNLYVTGSQPSLAYCASDVVDKATYKKLTVQQACAATYCGAGGTCVVTSSGAACDCASGFVSQRFTDLDGLASVACVPATPPVDLRANGEQLPDACLGKSCGAGTCIDRNGVAVCDCDAGTAATVGPTLPRCEPMLVATTTPGAEDFSDALADLDVCAPAYPRCGEGGWLEHVYSPRPGVACGNTSTPPDYLTHPGPAPTCPGTWPSFGCGCSTQGTPPMTSLAAFGLVGLLVLRRRSRGRGRSCVR